MQEYINKSDLLAALASKMNYADDVRNSVRAADYNIVKNFPCCVTRKTLEQIVYERIVAISQLNEIGKSLGENMDDIPMSRNYKYRWHDLQKDANDLPEMPKDCMHIKKYIVVYADGEQSMLMWAGGWNCVFNDDGTIYRDSELTDIIAWREVEPYGIDSDCTEGFHD